MEVRIAGQAEFLHPVIGLAFGGGAGLFGVGFIGEGGTAFGDFPEELLAAQGVGEVAAGLEGDGAIVGDDGEFAAMGGELDELGDDVVGGDASAGVGEGELGEFGGAGFVEFGAAVEDEGGVAGGGGEVAAELADGHVGEGAAEGGGGVNEVIGVDEVFHKVHLSKRRPRGRGLRCGAGSC